MFLGTHGKGWVITGSTPETATSAYVIGVPADTVILMNGAGGSLNQLVMPTFVSSGGAAFTSIDQSIVGGTRIFRLAGASSGTYNEAVQANDAAILFDISGIAGNGGLVIGPHGSGGIRISGSDGSVTDNGKHIFNGGVQNGGSLSISGCSFSTGGGSANGGYVVSDVSGICTLTISAPFTATNLWVCHGTDVTSGINFTQSGKSATQCGISGTSASGDTITFGMDAY